MPSSQDSSTEIKEDVLVKEDTYIKDCSSSEEFGGIEARRILEKRLYVAYELTASVYYALTLQYPSSRCFTSVYGRLTSAWVYWW
jgi:hypothetical protein